MYEIVIGGWGNSQSVIRTQSQGAPIYVYPGGFGDDTIPHNYQITLDGSSGTITVYEDGNVLFGYTDPNYLAHVQLFKTKTYNIISRNSSST